VWWIPEWQVKALNFSWSGGTVSGTIARRSLLLMPVLLVSVAIWSTMVSLYTIPFRAKRGKFLTLLALGWWDTFRGIWFYWTGLLRFAAMLVGWVWNLVALSVRLLIVGIKGFISSPLKMFDSLASRYLKPGVPWLAVMLTLIWCSLEATIFSFTLMPTLSEVLGDITGFVPNRFVVLPVLWLFLFFLIAGSFASILVMTEAIASRRIGQVIQMVVVEFFVAFFEVVFLYRELIDAITPWINQMSGGEIQMGLYSTLALGVFGWIGIRGMTWFLFGRFGTPSLIAILSRQVPMGDEGVTRSKAAVSQEMWRAPIIALKSETEWFREELRQGVELASLPVLQLVAMAVNFPVMAISSQPIFTFPLRSLDDVLADTPFPAMPRKSKAASAASAAQAVAKGRPTGDPMLGEATS
jgi:hypothetical protein